MYFLILFWLFSLISSLAYILSLSHTHTHYASEYSTLLELDSLHGIRAWGLEILHWALPLKLCEQPETLLQIGYCCCSVARQEAHVNRSIGINLNQKDECTTLPTEWCWTGTTTHLGNIRCNNTYRARVLELYQGSSINIPRYYKSQLPHMAARRH